MNNLLDFFPILMGIPGGGGAAPAGGSGQLVTTVVTFGLVILIFYFLIIRPQNKKQKDTKRMLADIKKGDKVATIGGIRGTVQKVSEETIIVKVDDSTKLEFSKSAVSSILEQSPAKKDSSKSDSAEKKKDSDENTETQEQE
jgi:preprotein translocase subunit YajC